MASGQQHTIDACSHPNYLVKCKKCLVVSFDQSGHVRPCRPVESVCRYSTDIYGKNPMKMFQLKVENADDEVYFFDKGTSCFENIGKHDEVQHIHAHPVEGLFLVRKIKNNIVIEYAATSLYRFSVAVAYFSEGAWRVRFRFVVTPDNGILGFKLYRTIEHHDGTLTILNDLNANTVLILGIKTKEVESAVRFRVFANESGMINDTSDAYYGKMSWNRIIDRLSISESLQVDTHGNTYRFNANLYELVGNPLFAAEATPSGESEVKHKL